MYLPTTITPTHSNPAASTKHTKALTQDASASSTEGAAPVLAVPSVVCDVEVHVIEEVVRIALLVLRLPSHREGKGYLMHQCSVLIPNPMLVTHDNHKLSKLIKHFLLTYFLAYGYISGVAMGSVFIETFETFNNSQTGALQSS